MSDIVLHLGLLGLSLLELCKLVHVGAEDLGSLDEVGQVDLLILGVCSVVARAHGKQDHVLAGRFLE